MFKFSSCLLILCPVVIWATETLHPIQPPKTHLTAAGIFELSDDVYSTDAVLSLEVAPIEWVSLYTDASFRFMSYSYETSIRGYEHNYCNLHVNGFNETYLGAKATLLNNFGLDINWRFPPGEGSQKNRFHRLNVEPFAFMNIRKNLFGGLSLRYNTFLEDANYKPGDEIGAKGSFIFNFFWNEYMYTGWSLESTFLFQARVISSKNYNLKKPYQDMKDKYQGTKMKFELIRHFEMFNKHIGFGINYEMHNGTLFGFETGHRVGLAITAP
ncbi:MAG: hypothetical protein J6U20_13205 [Fibrobacter sp.]|nr:hypothetical protein [Fibrobacter sp.]